MRKTGFRNILVYFCSALSFLAITVDFSCCANEETPLLCFLHSFKGMNILHAVLFLALYFFYRNADKRVGSVRNNLSVNAVSCLFSLFLLLGRSFELNGDWYLVFSSAPCQWIKSILLLGGSYLLFRYAIGWLFQILDEKLKSSHTENRSPLCRPASTGRADRSLVVFFSLFLLYIPTMLISYPATLMGDTNHQVMQVYYDQITLHHSVLHTFLIHWFLLLGERIYSFSSGFFLYAFFQELVLLAALSVSFCRGAFSGRSRWLTLLFISYYFLHPLIHHYVFLVTKDIIYAAFFTLFLFLLYQCLRAEKPKKTQWICLAGTGIGMILFRNDGRYILLIAFLLMALICRKQRKAMLLQFFAMLVFSVFIFRILFPALSYIPGSRREMLSVPFQQTARYLRDYGDDVSEDERETINAILEYESLDELYNPDLSDPVKNTFRNDSGTRDILNYLRAWAKMFIRHPGSYIQATINNYYQYFYPGTARFNYYSFAWSEKCMESVNKNLEYFGKRVNYPVKYAEARAFIDQLIPAVYDFPGFSILSTPAFYTWLLILMLSYGFYRRNRKCTALLMLPVFRLMMNCLSPANGYYSRYSFPLIIAMPLLLMYFYQLLRDNPENG